MEENKKEVRTQEDIMEPQLIMALCVVVFVAFLAIRIVNSEWVMALLAGALIMLFDALRIDGQIRKDWKDTRQRGIWQDWPLWLRLFHAGAIGVFGATVTLAFLDTVFFHGFDLVRLFNAAVVVTVAIVFANFSRMDHSDIDENRPD